MRVAIVQKPAILKVVLLLVCLLSAWAFACFESPHAFAVETDGSQTSAIDDASLRYRVFSDSGKTEQSNLVLFVKFKGDESTVLNSAYVYSEAGKLDYSNFQYIKDDFDTGSYGNSSLQAYLKMASNGKYNVTSYFPQQVSDIAIPDASGNSFTAQQIRYIQLDNTEAYYREQGSDALLVSDTLAKFNASYTSYNPSELDADDDGYIDNITFVFQLQTKPTAQSDVFWPHMWSETSLGSTYKIGTRELSTYNFLYTLSAPSDNDKISMGISSGVTVHEYLHTLGLQDYYNNTLQASNGSPASPWDIMADKSYNYFMLSNTRELLGWTSVPDISQAYSSKTINADKSTTYTCTLYKPFSASGNQSVELYTPMSSSEHFVFEYRKKTDMTNNPLQPDSSLYINNSGLIAYRVNENVTSKSNFNDSDGFYVYVFRPGETGVNAGGGNTFEAPLETSAYAASGLTYGARTTFGSSDLTATPASAATSTGGGTIYYADGSNSGVTVEVTGQTDDSITFNVTVPDYSDLGLWDQTGSSTASGAAGDTSMEVGADGTVYQAYKDNSAIKARSWNGSSWTSLGTIASGETVQSPKLKMVGSTLYCIYANFVDGSSTVECKKLSGGSWASSGSISTGSAYSQLPTPASINGALYVLVDKNTGTESPAQLYKLSGSVFSTVGGTLGTAYTLAPTLTSFNDRIYVVCGDNSSAGEKIYRLDGSAWTNASTIGGNYAKATAAVAESGSLITFADLQDGSGKSISKTIASVSASGTSTTYAFDKVSANIISSHLDYVDGNVYLSLLDGTGVASTWYASVADLSTWTQLGANAYSKSSTMDAVTDGKKIYVGVTTSDTSSALVVSHDITGSQTMKHAVTFKDWDGTILGQPQTVDDGASASAPANPVRTGYAFAGWDKAFTNVTDDLVVTATYAINRYTITASAGAGGTITPSGDTSVAYGGSQIYTVIPQDGYVIYDIAVDGTSVGAANSYTFKAIEAVHSIVVSFMAKASVSLNDARVSAIPDQPYTGIAVTPRPNISVGSNVLLEGKDYTLEYFNNIEPGEAKVDIKGIGGYTGVESVSFKVTVPSGYCADVLGCGDGAAYTIHTKRAMDRLVDVAGRSVDNGGNVQMYHGNETPAQRFFVTFTKAVGEYGYYTVRNVYSGRVLDVAGGGTADATNVQQWEANDTAAQQWTAEDAGDGYWVLRSVGSGKVLDVSGNSDANGANLQIYTVNGSTAQMFAFKPCKQDIAEGEPCTLFNVANSGRAVDVSGASADNGANIWLYDSNGTVAQKFKYFYEAETGYYTIVNAKSGKAVDVAGAGEANGSNVQQYEKNGTWAQKWSLKPNSDSTWTLFCACNGRCFDLAGGSVANRTNIWCWDFNGTPAQKWRMATE